MTETAKRALNPLPGQEGNKLAHKEKVIISVTSMEENGFRESHFLHMLIFQNHFGSDLVGKKIAI